MFTHIHALDVRKLNAPPFERKKGIILKLVSREGIEVLKLDGEEAPSHSPLRHSPTLLPRTDDGESTMFDERAHPLVLVLFVLSPPRDLEKREGIILTAHHKTVSAHRPTMEVRGWLLKKGGGTHLSRTSFIARRRFEKKTTEAAKTNANEGGGGGQLSPVPALWRCVHSHLPAHEALRRA